jgi:hypothetical protein
VFMALSALRTEWDDLLERRPAFRATLDVYGEILDRWGRWAPAGSPSLGWAAAQCHERWERGVPLLAEAPPPTSAAEVEDLLGALMERLAETVDGAAPALQRLA